MIAFVTTPTIEWEWERLARVAALAGHSFVCAAELDASTHRPSDDTAAPAVKRVEDLTSRPDLGARPRGTTG